MASIGKKLCEVREAKALSIEDVAHRTRINGNVIRKLEIDDLSSFASIGYAKSFLKQYGDFLDVDVSDAVAALVRGETKIIGKSAVDTMVSGVKQKIERSNSFRPSRPKGPRRRRVEKPGGAPVFLGFILVVLVLAIGIFYFLGYNANSPDELKEQVTEKLAGITSGSSDGKDSSKPESVVPEIEKNPFSRKKETTPPPSTEVTGTKADLPKTISPSPVKIEEPGVGKPLSKAKAPASRTGELPRLDFNNGSITAGQPDVRVPNPPTPSSPDSPAALRPKGTDPVEKRPDQKIIRAIPIPEAVVTERTRN